MLQVRIDNVNYPIRNIVFEKIKHLGTTTDQDLLNSMSKDGLIRVSWLTKDKKRIELTQ